MWNEVLKDLFLILSSGSLTWLLQFRMNRRRHANVLHQADFNTVSEVVKKAMEQLSEMADRIGVLEKENVALHREITQHQTTISTMRREIDAWKGLSRELVTDQKQKRNG